MRSKINYYFSIIKNNQEEALQSNSHILSNFPKKNKKIFSLHHIKDSKKPKKPTNEKRVKNKLSKSNGLNENGLINKQQQDDQKDNNIDFSNNGGKGINNNNPQKQTIFNNNFNNNNIHNPGTIIINNNINTINISIGNNSFPKSNPNQRSSYFTNNFNFNDNNFDLNFSDKLFTKNKRNRDDSSFSENTPNPNLLNPNFTYSGNGNNNDQREKHPHQHYPYSHNYPEEDHNYQSFNDLFNLSFNKNLKTNYFEEHEDHHLEKFLSFENIDQKEMKHSIEREVHDCKEKDVMAEDMFFVKVMINIFTLLANKRNS